MGKASIQLIVTYSQEMIQSPLAPPSRCEIGNSGPNVATQQQFADSMEREKSCYIQQMTLETVGNEKSRRMIRDADQDLQPSDKSSELGSPTQVEIAENKLKLMHYPYPFFSELSNYTKRNL